MSERKQGLRALGVSLLALLGLMAFMVAGAQATTGAKWLVLGGNLTSTKKVTFEKHSETALLLVGGTFNITIHCTTVKSEDVLILGEGELTGKLAFSGCTASQGGAALPKCDPINQPIVSGGRSLTILHNGESYILLSPPTGETKFTTIKFGELCSLAPSKNVTGTLVAECGHLSAGAFVHLDCKNEEASHLLRQAPEALFSSDALLFGNKPASLDGIVKAFLTPESKPITAELHSTTALLVIGGTFNITIDCTTVASEEMTIFGEGELTGKLGFSQCTTSQTGTPIPKCDPINQPIVAGGKALLILHNSQTYVLFEPTTGGAEGAFATIKFGNECNLAPSKNVTGTFVAECGHLSAGAFVHLDCKTEEASHLLRQAPAVLFPSDSIQFGAKPVSLDGIFKVSLIGEPTEKWGGIG